MTELPSLLPRVINVEIDIGLAEAESNPNQTCEWSMEGSNSSHILASEGGDSCP